MQSAQRAECMQKGASALFTSRQATAASRASLAPHTGFDSYRSSVARNAPLDRETERALARRYREGDRHAGEQLIEACLPFVVSIAFEYRRWGAPLEDIVQEGNLGLLRAAEKFDPEREVRLVTYAAYWIRASIRDYVVRSYRLVRLGTTKGERRVVRAYRTAAAPTIHELAELSGLSEARVESLLPLLSRREASLDDAGPNGEGTIHRLIATDPTPEQACATHEADARSKDAIEAALATLSERERYIVEHRMMCEDPETLQSIGAQLGVSKERVRQIEERARGKLRTCLADLADFAEAS